MASFGGLGLSHSRIGWYCFAARTRSRGMRVLISDEWFATRPAMCCRFPNWGNVLGASRGNLHGVSNYLVLPQR